MRNPNTREPRTKIGDLDLGEIYDTRTHISTDGGLSIDSLKIERLSGCVFTIGGPSPEAEKVKPAPPTPPPERKAAGLASNIVAGVTATAIGRVFGLT